MTTEDTEAPDTGLRVPVVPRLGVAWDLPIVAAAPSWRETPYHPQTRRMELCRTDLLHPKTFRH